MDLNNNYKKFTGHRARLKDELKGLKVIYTDLDGTLLNDSGCLIKDDRGRFFYDSIKLFKRAEEKNWDIVLVSGRNKLQLKYNAMMVGAKNYIPELGCELVYDFGKEVHVTFDIKNYNYSITRGGSDLLNIIKILKEAFPGKIDSHIDWSMERSYNALFFGEINVDIANEVLNKNGYEKIALVDNGFSKIVKLDIDVKDLRIYNLVPRGVDKSSAIKLDKKLRKLDSLECIALGDSIEDLKMAKEVHAFFLMRDALERNSDLWPVLNDYENVYVTSHSMNRGWAEVIKYLAD